MKKFKAFVFLMLGFSLYGCTDYSNQIHYDGDKNAMVACDGIPIKEVRVSTPKVDIVYEGVDTIYFNKPTKASKITLGYDSVVVNFILKLEPSSSYNFESRSRNGDQSPWTKVLKTDSKGSIIHDDKNLICY